MSLVSGLAFTLCFSLSTAPLLAQSWLSGEPPPAPPESPKEEKTFNLELSGLSLEDCLVRIGKILDPKTPRPPIEFRDQAFGARDLPLNLQAQGLTATEVLEVLGAQAEVRILRQGSGFRVLPQGIPPLPSPPRMDLARKLAGKKITFSGSSFPLGTVLQAFSMQYGLTPAIPLRVARQKIRIQAESLDGFEFLELLSLAIGARFWVDGRLVRVHPHRIKPTMGALTAHGIDQTYRKTTLGTGSRGTALGKISAAMARAWKLNLAFDPDLESQTIKIQKQTRSPSELCRTLAEAAHAEVLVAPPFLILRKRFEPDPSEASQAQADGWMRPAGIEPYEDADLSDDFGPDLDLDDGGGEPPYPSRPPPPDFEPIPDKF